MSEKILLNVTKVQKLNYSKSSLYLGAKIHNQI
jgi:hypothetical protein